MTQQQIIQNNFNAVRSSVCQLYVRTGDESFKGLGTGVLVYIFGMHLLLTASHCLYDKDNPHSTLPLDKSYIGAGVDLFGLGGDGVQVKELIVKGEEIAVDLAWIRLNERTAQRLQAHRRFLTAEDLDVHDIQAAKEIYMILGVRGFNPKPLSRIEVKELITIGYMAIAVDESLYQKEQRLAKNCYLARFNRKKAYIVENEKKQIPGYPSGVSGGGMFNCTKIVKGKAVYVPPKLVGIVHTFDEQIGHIFISDKLDLFIRSIILKYNVKQMTALEAHALLKFSNL